MRLPQENRHLEIWGSRITTQIYTLFMDNNKQKKIYKASHQSYFIGRGNDMVSFHSRQLKKEQRRSQKH